MAFNKANVQEMNNASGANIPEAKRAKAYINLYLPKPDGTRAKVGSKGIMLTGASAYEAKLLERLAMEDGETAFAENVIIEIHFINENVDAVELGF